MQSNVKEIFSAYKIFRVLIPGENTCYIYQYDNYIFKEPDLELKLTHQSGKTDKYNFELEASRGKVNLNQVLKDLGLSKMVTLTNVEFWDKWNDELNLKDTDLSDKQILVLIKKYLNPEGGLFTKKYGLIFKGSAASAPTHSQRHLYAQPSAS